MFLGSSKDPAPELKDAPPPVTPRAKRFWAVVSRDAILHLVVVYSQFRKTTPVDVSPEDLDRPNAA